jgi:hypothetical protein
MRGVQGGFEAMRWVLGALGLSLLVGASALHAAPFVPERDDLVLEELPAGTARAADRELRALAAALDRDPSDVERAAAFAWRAIELGRRESDPRYFGRAQSALAPWWNEVAAPSPVLLLRATLRQNRHEFDAALRDLELLLSREPRHAQAWLTRAVIQTVRARFPEAQRSCAALLGLGDRLTATTCLAQVASLSGRAERSHALLAQAALASARERETSAAPSAAQSEADEGGGDERLWALTTLGEIAARLGRAGDAERWFDRAAEIAPGDTYLLAARADLWLDRSRPEAVIERLARETRRDGLLLRLAIAECRLAHPGCAAHVEELRSRFAAARMRGDRLHLGEESRFALELLGDPRLALRLAAENFELQREPRDLRALLAAALAARDRAAAEPALALLRASRLEDIAAAALAQQIESELR